MRCFLYNFLAALSCYVYTPNWLETLIVNGCEKHTPPTHRWHDEPMF